MENLVLHEIMMACVDTGKFGEEDMKELREIWKILLNEVMAQINNGFNKRLSDNLSLTDGYVHLLYAHYC